MTDVIDPPAVETPLPKTTPPMATLDDLKLATITVVVMLADGEERTLKLHNISRLRIYQIRNSVPEPMPPIVDYLAANKPVYNTRDQGYIAQMAEVNYKRNSLVLLEMLQLEIPGETTDERLAFMQEQLDPMVYDALLEVVTSILEKAKARIISRADTF